MLRKLIMALTALVLSLGTAAPAFAEEMVAGEVTKVDESAGKITIKHGPIKKFDMEAMTMVFYPNDPAMLKPSSLATKSSSSPKR